MAAMSCISAPREPAFFKSRSLSVSAWEASGQVTFPEAGLSIFGILLSLHGLSFAQVLGLLAVLGFCAGFFAVPINALIQHRPDEVNRGGTIAAANLLSWIGIGAATGVYYLLQHSFKLSPSAIF